MIRPLHYDMVRRVAGDHLFDPDVNVAPNRQTARRDITTRTIRARWVELLVALRYAGVDGADPDDLLLPKVVYRAAADLLERQIADPTVGFDVGDGGAHRELVDAARAWFRRVVG